MTFWRIRAKIIITVLCCIVYDSCAQWYAHTWTVLNDECWFRFRFCFCAFALCFFLISLAYFVLLLFAFVAKFLQHYTKRLDRKNQRTSPKWPILCRVGHKTLTQSTNWLGSGVGELVQREWLLSWWIGKGWGTMHKFPWLKSVLWVAFSTLQLLIQRQEGHLICERPAPIYPQSFSFGRLGLTLTDYREEGSSSSSSCVLSGAGCCHSYERAPGLMILCLTIAGCQTNVARSDSEVWSQVWSGQPDWQFHSLGKRATHAVRAPLWSVDGSARAMWMKNLRRVVPMMCVSGCCLVHRRTSSLEMWALQEMRNISRRHHWSNASRILASCRVGDRASAP